MTFILRRSSLVTQVTDSIRSEILRNPRQKQIPSERELSRMLNVSRNTCRQALHVLRVEKLVEPAHFRGSSVSRHGVQKALSAAKRTYSVGILIPCAIERLRPQVSLTIEHLRNELFDLDVPVQLHNGAAYFQSDPRAPLEKLFAKSPHDCWVMFISTRAQQLWFMKRRIPCVVCGSLYPGIQLPSVDQHFRAICRHAAGRLISLNHRRLAFFNRRSRGAGDLESEIGFLEGVRSSSHRIDAQIVYHDDDGRNVSALVNDLFGSGRPPTGLLIASSHCYLAVVTALSQRRQRVPDEVSIICREDDPFLNYLVPEPSRYFDDHIRICHKVMILLRHLLARGSASLKPVRLSPRFAPGGSCRKI